MPSTLLHRPEPAARPGLYRPELRTTFASTTAGPPARGPTLTIISVGQFRSRLFRFRVHLLPRMGSFGFRFSRFRFICSEMKERTVWGKSTWLTISLYRKVHTARSLELIIDGFQLSGIRISIGSFLFSQMCNRPKAEVPWRRSETRIFRR